MTLYEIFQILLLLSVVIAFVIVCLTGFIWLMLKMISIAIDIIADAWADVCVSWRNRK